METNSDVQIGDLAVVAALPFVLGAFFWLLLSVAAAVVAPEGRRFTFFICTLLFLGPLGLHAALVAGYRTE